MCGAHAHTHAHTHTHTHAGLHTCTRTCLHIPTLRCSTLKQLCLSNCGIGPVGASAIGGTLVPEADPKAAAMQPKWVHVRPWRGGREPRRLWLGVLWGGEPLLLSDVIGATVGHYQEAVVSPEVGCKSEQAQCNKLAWRIATPHLPALPGCCPLQVLEPQPVAQPAGRPGAGQPVQGPGLLRDAQGACGSHIRVCVCCVCVCVSVCVWSLRLAPGACRKEHENAFGILTECSLLRQRCTQPAAAARDLQLRCIYRPAPLASVPHSCATHLGRPQAAALDPSRGLQHSRAPATTPLTRRCSTCVLWAWMAPVRVTWWGCSTCVARCPRTPPSTKSTWT